MAISLADPIHEHSKMNDVDSSGTSQLPIHGILALEAVVRLGSVQAAANELSVTPSGISHRIATLERRIGQPLLQKRGRGVMPTSVAWDYLEAVRPGLHKLSHFTAELVAREQGTVRVATAAAIGATWVLPAIKRFSARQAEAYFELRTLAVPDELSDDQWDVQVHFGNSLGRRPSRRRLFVERLVHVGAPVHEVDTTSRQAPGGTLEKSASAKAPHLRLAQLTPPSARQRRRLSSAAPQAQIVFDDALAMLEAAAAGAGIALTALTDAKGFLVQGRLELLGRAELSEGYYWVDISESGRLKPLASALYDWLIHNSGAA